MTPLRKSRHSSKPSTVIYSTDGELRRSDYGFIFSDDIDNKQREETFKKENVI